MQSKCVAKPGNKAKGRKATTSMLLETVLRATHVEKSARNSVPFFSVGVFLVFLELKCVCLRPPGGFGGWGGAGFLVSRRQAQPHGFLWQTGNRRPPLCYALFPGLGPLSTHATLWRKGLSLVVLQSLRSPESKTRLSSLKRQQYGYQAGTSSKLHS